VRGDHEFYRKLATAQRAACPISLLVQEAPQESLFYSSLCCLFAIEGAGKIGDTIVFGLLRRGQQPSDRLTCYMISATRRLTFLK
jgi:hypothetical protein